MPDRIVFQPEPTCWTEAPESGYDGDTFAADQIALLDALGMPVAAID